jgi:hypothetical protein
MIIGNLKYQIHPVFLQLENPPQINMDRNPYDVHSEYKAANTTMGMAAPGLCSGPRYCNRSTDHGFILCFLRVEPGDISRNGILDWIRSACNCSGGLD